MKHAGNSNTEKQPAEVTVGGGKKKKKRKKSSLIIPFVFSPTVTLC